MQTLPSPSLFPYTTLFRSPFLPAADLPQGDLLPVYRRADLSRIMTFVVALFLTMAATSAFAREFRAADTQNEEYPTVDRKSTRLNSSHVEISYAVFCLKKK